MGKKERKEMGIINRINTLLFTEEHVLTVDSPAALVTNEGLTQAVTANEKLADYGFVLRPEDVVKLAGYPASTMKGLLDQVEANTDLVRAQPMYHDFPTEVMEMSEAQFRFDQLCHYFTTYGVEALFAVEVNRGWLPDDGDEDHKTRDDKSLLSLKVLAVRDRETAYREAVTSILSKKERMTAPEKELVTDIVAVCRPNVLDGIHFGFKENMEDLFASFLLSDELGGSVAKVPVLRKLCQHSGDALRGIKAALSEAKWRLTTSQKRAATRLLDTFTPEDLEENLWISKKKSEEAKRVLAAISYNSHSKNPENQAVVNAARNNELTSFEGRVKARLEGDPTGAAVMAAKRPGSFLRMLTLFLRNGVGAETLSDLLSERAEALSAVSLVGVLNAFGDKCVNAETEEDKVFQIARTALERHFAAASTPIKGMKVYIADSDIDIALSRLDANAKSADGGFLGSGLAYRIPDDAKVIRGFVYWDDEVRVDLDLHCYGYDRECNAIHIGWCGNFEDSGVVHSGDITHSDAAEYIDAAVNSSAAVLSMSVDLYSGRPSFQQVETCFAGIMAVNSLDEEVKLYNPKNCFISHELRQQARTVDYGYIDLVHKVVVFHGKPVQEKRAGVYGSMPDVDHLVPGFSLEDYLDLVIASQDAVRVNSPEEADITLVFNKALNESELSLADENFFLGC